MILYGTVPGNAGVFLKQKVSKSFRRIRTTTNSGNSHHLVILSCCLQRWQEVKMSRRRRDSQIFRATAKILRLRAQGQKFITTSPPFDENPNIMLRVYTKTWGQLVHKSSPKLFWGRRMVHSNIKHVYICTRPQRWGQFETLNPNLIENSPTAATLNSISIFLSNNLCCTTHMGLIALQQLYVSREHVLA